MKKYKNNGIIILKKKEFESIINYENKIYRENLTKEQNCIKIALKK